MRVAPPLAELTTMTDPSDPALQPREVERSPIWAIPSTFTSLGSGALSDAIQAAQMLSRATSKDLPLVGPYTHDLAREAQPVAVMRGADGTWRGAFLASESGDAPQAMRWIYEMKNDGTGRFESAATGDGSDTVVDSVYSPELAAIVLPNRAWKF